MVAIERFFQYLKQKKLRPTPVEKELGFSNGYLGKMWRRKASIGSDALEKIIYKFPDLNSEWLLTGNGDMIKEKTKSEENVLNLKTSIKTKSEENVLNLKEDKNEDILKKNKKCTKSPHLESPETPENTNHVDKPHLKFQLRTDQNLEIQHIPLYNIEAVAGLIPLFTGNVYHTDEYIQIPNLPRCDGAIYITGDSMYPLLKSGDIVLYKQINDIANNIFYGEMYLISIDMEGDEYITVKYIQKSEKEGHIILVSYNKAHSDKEIHINSIKALAFVKASIRINAMA